MDTESVSHQTSSLPSTLPPPPSALPYLGGRKRHVCRTALFLHPFHPSLSSCLLTIPSAASFTKGLGGARVGGRPSPSRSSAAALPSSLRPSPISTPTPSHLPPDIATTASIPLPLPPALADASPLCSRRPPALATAASTPPPSSLTPLSSPGRPSMSPTQPSLPTSACFPSSPPTSSPLPTSTPAFSPEPPLPAPSPSPLLVLRGPRPRLPLSPGPPLPFLPRP